MIHLNRNLARKAGLGRLAYLAWHTPLAGWRRSRREGGFVEQWKTRLGRSRMEACAARLAPPFVDPKAAPLRPHLLTGKRFWYQTAFCLWSLGAQTRRPLAPVIYDDGSLTEEQAAMLSGLFPKTRFIWHEDAAERLAERLPANRFPTLHRRWADYPNIRKLLDVHPGADDWRLVLDSDMLFFRRPDQLLAWLSTPDRPLVSEDCSENYGYSRELLRKISGITPGPLINVGLCGLRGSRIDWDELEHWCTALEAEAGTSYYLEQALIALLVSKSPGGYLRLPATDYRCMPDAVEAARPSAVLHHFVDLSKAAYFRRSWRIAVTTTGALLP